MDFPNTQLDHYDRIFNTQTQLVGSGSIEKKASWVDRTFESFNVSFILEGSGAYLWNEISYPVLAPCIILQKPGIRALYGPTPSGSFWREIFLIFDPKAEEEFRKEKLIGENEWGWPIENLETTLNALQLLKAALRQFADYGGPDRIDLLTRYVLLESKLPKKKSDPESSRHDSPIQEAIDYVTVQFQDEIDFESLAQRCGMSYPTFLRHWNAQMHLRPLQYLTEIRMREARRLLVNSKKTIAEIGLQCGFSDPLYFSRRFANFHKIPPRDYRRIQN